MTKEVVSSKRDNSVKNKDLEVPMESYEALSIEYKKLGGKILDSNGLRKQTCKFRRIIFLLDSRDIIIQRQRSDFN
jgi:hypothetical protein